MLIKEEGDREQQSVDGMESNVAHELSVTIRFRSSESSGRPSCLQIGGTQGDPAQTGGGSRDCTAGVQADWQWERIVSPEGSLSLLHSMSADDAAALSKGSDPQAQQWDICVASTSRDSDSDSGSGTSVRGVITLSQQKMAPSTLVDAVEAVRKPPGTESMQVVPVPEHGRAPRLSLPSGSGVEGGGGGGGTVAERPQQRYGQEEAAGSRDEGGGQVLGAAPGHPTLSAADTPVEVDVYVDSPVDEAANSSLCDLSLNRSSAISGQCNLRSAVASCEALLQTPTTTLCSVHLPALSLIVMQPALGELYVQGVQTNGTLSIVGNGCQVSPDASNASSSDSTRFLRVDGGHSLTFRLSNLSVSLFGNSTMDGGAMYLHDVLSDDSSGMQNVHFSENMGRKGGALYISQCAHMTITACTFTNNSANDDGGGLYVDTDSVHMTFRSCSFATNTAEFSGGGMFVQIRNHNMTLISCTFEENSARAGGGGMYVNSNNHMMEFKFCNFTKNILDNAYEDEYDNGGGGLYVNNNNLRVTLSFCAFTGNIGQYRGGGLTVYYDNSYIHQ